MTFLERVQETLKRLMTSGKVWTALMGKVINALARRGIVLSPEDANTVMWIFMTLIGAQGAADFSKEKAKVESNAPVVSMEADMIKVSGGK